MKKLFNILIIFFIFSSNVFAADEIEKGKTLLKSLSKKSLTKKETTSFLKEYAIIVEDERGDGKVTYIFDDDNYSRYKGTEIISSDAWRFSKLGALRLFNKDVKMTWKIKISDKENLINIKTKFDPVGKLYEFEVKTKKEFLDQIEQIKQAEIQKKEAIEKANIEKKKKFEQEKLAEEQKLKEEERKLEEEKRKLEEERLATEQKLEEEKRKLEEEKLALQKELEELKKKKAEELEQSEKTPTQIKKEERERKKQEKLTAKKKAKEEKEKLKQEKLAAQQKAKEEKERLKREKLSEKQKNEEKKYYWQGNEVSKEEHDRLLNELKNKAEKNLNKLEENKGEREQEIKRVSNAAYEAKLCIMSIPSQLNNIKYQLLNAHESLANEVVSKLNRNNNYIPYSYIDEFGRLHGAANRYTNCRTFPYTYWPG